MKKTIFILVFLLAIVFKSYSQSSCDQFNEVYGGNTEAYFADFKSALTQNIPRLKTTRQWARKMNKPEVELATNRLEYWAKKFNQFIDQNLKKNPNAVCEKFENEREYIVDFLDLTTMFLLTNTSSHSNLDYSKYK